MVKPHWKSKMLIRKARLTREGGDTILFMEITSHIFSFAWKAIIMLHSGKNDRNSCVEDNKTELERVQTQQSRLTEYAGL